MKSIKYGIIASLLFFSAGCLKSKNDIGGLLTDQGSIVSSIVETNYLHTDAQNIGLGVRIYSNFDFATPAQEEVRFFTVHVSTPRSKKLSGPLKLKVTMSAADRTLPPAGAITIPAEITIPAFDGESFDYPVKFMVNKAALDPAEDYEARFTISAPNQGAVSRNESSVDVAFNNDKYYGRYKVTCSVEDPQKEFGLNNSIRFVNLSPDGPNALGIYDFTQDAFGAPSPDAIMPVKLSTGAATALIYPLYILDASGKVVDIANVRTGTSYNPSFNSSASNKFIYTSNDNRDFSLKYTVSYTSTINNVSVTRPITITEKYVYDTPQAFY